MGVRSSASWPMQWRQLLVFVAVVSASSTNLPTSSPSNPPSTTPTITPTLEPTVFTCVSGEYVNGDGKCALCPEGKFTNFVGQPFPTSCENCTIGTYTSQVGTDECVQCETGKISAKDHSYCVDCKAGQYTNESTACVDCPTGKYAPQALDYCLDCPAGSQTSGIAVGAKTCSPCDTGTYSTYGAPNCTLCAPGQFSDSGQVKCTLCPAGQYSAKVAAASCLPCTADHKKGFTSLAGATSCSICEANFVLQEDPVEAGDDDLDLNGVANPEDPEAVGEPRCAECALLGGRFEGAKCPTSGTTVPSLGLKAGYWRTSNTSDEILSCPQPEFCSGGYLSGINATSSYCVEGHEGPYCTVCSGDYFPSLLGVCQQCEGGLNLEGLLIALATLAGLVAAGFAIKKLKPHKRISEVGYRRAKNMGKIIFVFVQILCAVPDIFDSIFPSPFRGFLSILGLPALSFPFVSIFGCFGASLRNANYYTQLLISTLLPWGINFLIFFYFYVSKWRMYRASKARLDSGIDAADVGPKKGCGVKINCEMCLLCIDCDGGSDEERGKKEPSNVDEGGLSEKQLHANLRSKCIGISLLVLYVFLPVASRVVFGIFACESFDDGSNMLVADFSLSCDDQRYVGYRIFCIIMLFVWPIGIPLTFTGLLARKIQRCPVMYDLISPFPLLFIVFLCELSRSLPIFMFPLQQKHQRIRGNRILDVVPKAVALSSLSTPAEVQLTDEIVALRDCDSSLDGIRFLFDTYRPQVWFWELVVTARRLVLTGALVSLPRGSVEQYSVGLFVCVFGSLMQTSYSPYLGISENVLAFMVEINTFLVIYMAFVASLKESIFEGEQGEELATFLTVLTTVVIVFGLIVVNISVFSKAKRSQFKAGLAGAGLKKKRRQKQGSVTSLEGFDPGDPFATKERLSKKSSIWGSIMNLKPTSSTRKLEGSLEMTGGAIRHSDSFGVIGNSDVFCDGIELPESNMAGLNVQDRGARGSVLAETIYEYQEDDFMPADFDNPLKSMGQSSSSENPGNSHPISLQPTSAKSAPNTIMFSASDSPPQVAPFGNSSSSEQVTSLASQSLPALNGQKQKLGSTPPPSLPQPPPTESVNRPPINLGTDGDLPAWSEGGAAPYPNADLTVGVRTRTAPVSNEGRASVTPVRSGGFSRFSSMGSVPSSLLTKKASINETAWQTRAPVPVPEAAASGDIEPPTIPQKPNAAPPPLPASPLPIERGNSPQLISASTPPVATPLTGEPRTEAHSSTAPVSNEGRASVTPVRSGGFSRFSTMGSVPSNLLSKKASINETAWQTRAPVPVPEASVESASIPLPGGTKAVTENTSDI